MKKAQDIASKSPKKIITDKLFAYIDGIELVFGADTEHVGSRPFVDTDSTNVIERFQGDLPPVVAPLIELELPVFWSQEQEAGSPVSCEA